MFVDKKKHRSGRTSVVVVDKSHGKFREKKTSEWQVAIPR